MLLGVVCIGRSFLGPDLTGVLQGENCICTFFRRREGVGQEVGVCFRHAFTDRVCNFVSPLRLDSPAFLLIRLGTPSGRRTTRNPSRQRLRITSDLPPLEEEVGIPTSPVTM